MTFRKSGDQQRAGFEFHELYYGTNAQAFIETAPEGAPGMVAVGIDQSDNEFWIHFISFDEECSPKR